MDANVLKKLKIDKFEKVAVLNAPDTFTGLLKNFKGSVNKKITGQYSYVQVFIKSQSEFVQLGESLTSAVDGDGYLWVCYPKGTSKNFKKVDCNRDTLREAIVSCGFEGVFMISLDNDWSAMRFRNSKYVGK